MKPLRIGADLRLGIDDDPVEGRQRRVRLGAKVDFVLPPGRGTSGLRGIGAESQQRRVRLDRHAEPVADPLAGVDRPDQEEHEPRQQRRTAHAREPLLDRIEAHRERVRTREREEDRHRVAQPDARTRGELHRDRARRDRRGQDRRVDPGILRVGQEDDDRDQRGDERTDQTDESGRERRRDATHVEARQQQRHQDQHRRTAPVGVERGDREGDQRDDHALRREYRRPAVGPVHQFRDHRERPPAGALFDGRNRERLGDRGAPRAGRLGGESDHQRHAAVEDRDALDEDGAARGRPIAIRYGIQLGATALEACDRRVGGRERSHRMSIPNRGRDRLELLGEGPAHRHRRVALRFDESLRMRQGVEHPTHGVQPEHEPQALDERVQVAAAGGAPLLGAKPGEHALGDRALLDRPLRLRLGLPIERSSQHRRERLHSSGDPLPQRLFEGAAEEDESKGARDQRADQDLLRRLPAHLAERSPHRTLPDQQDRRADKHHEVEHVQAARRHVEADEPVDRDEGQDEPGLLLQDGPDEVAARAGDPDRDDAAPEEPPGVRHERHREHRERRQHAAGQVEGVDERRHDRCGEQERRGARQHLVPAGQLRQEDVRRPAEPAACSPGTGCRRRRRRAAHGAIARAESSAS